MPIPKQWFESRIDSEGDSQVEAGTLRCSWIDVVRKSEQLLQISQSIQYLIMDELRKATCNSAYSSDPINGVLLGHTEYAALKKSIQDGVTLRVDYPFMEDNIVFNGLTVLEVNKPGITIAKLYNT